jgi:tRNA(Ile)-lysidine synthase
MSGPHPAVAEVRRAVRAALLDEPQRRGEAVLVACSGGADSLALAAALAFEAPRAGVAAGLVTIDHGLQPGSGQQAARVAAIGAELGLDPVHLIQVAVPGGGAGGGGPEAAARTARYAALDTLTFGIKPSDTKESRQKCEIWLGHTLDDQAETVLLGLGRGSGPRSIAGMRPVTGAYRRPLLGVRRASTRAACVALGLPLWDDPHNADPAFQRVRLRHEVLPLLEDVLQGGVAEALARTATLLQADLDALDQAASVHFAGRAELAVAAVENLAPAIRSRVLREWAIAHGVPPGELSAAQLRELDRLITHWRGQGPIQLPGRFDVIRSSGTLCLRAQLKIGS